VPDGFVGAEDWYDAAVDAAGDVYVSTGSVTTTQARAHPNTEPGFEQYSLLKIDGRNGSLIWKAPAPRISGDPDYASSAILFTGNGVDLVGATNKDGWFRAYRRTNGTLTWQALVGTFNEDGAHAALSGGVWDGSRLFVASNATQTGGTCTQYPIGAWTPVGGSPAAGSVRALDPATGALVAVRSGQPYELALPSNVLAPCSMNTNLMLVCAGGKLGNIDLTGHENGLFVMDTTKAPAVLCHREDVRNFGAFSQPALEHGAILTANTEAFIKWAP
jgi:hypothetical protein